MMEYWNNGMLAAVKCEKRFYGVNTGFGGRGFVLFKDCTEQKIKTDYIRF
jgi:histidine ammonia-lyase